MQNPPPGQPSAPTGQQSSLGMAPNLAAMLCYLGALAVHVIVGLIFFFVEKENRFVRFHAMQSVLYVVACTAVMIVLAILNGIIAVVFSVAASATNSGIIGMLVGLITMVIWLVIPLIYIGGLILGGIKAYQNTKFKFPIIGNLAEKIASGGN